MDSGPALYVLVVVRGHSEKKNTCDPELPEVDLTRTDLVLRSISNVRVAVLYFHWQRGSQ